MRNIEQEVKELREEIEQQQGNNAVIEILNRLLEERLTELNDSIGFNHYD